MARDFPVNSISVRTKRCAYGCHVLQRASVSRYIAFGGCYNCRQTAGSTLWSPHARGDAVDLFPAFVRGMTTTQVIERIGRAAVRHATKVTVANRGRKMKAVHVIFGTTEVIIEDGRVKVERVYQGTPHTSHVHVGFSFSTTVRPPCAS